MFKIKPLISEFRIKKLSEIFQPESLLVEDKSRFFHFPINHYGVSKIKHYLNYLFKLIHTLFFISDLGNV